MESIQAIDDELAITRYDLEQATVLLAEKDQEIASLREELSRLRQRTPSTQDSFPYSTPTDPVENAWEHNDLEPASDTPAPLTPHLSRSIESAETPTKDGTAGEQHAGNDPNSTFEQDAAGTSSNKSQDSQNEEAVSDADSQRNEAPVAPSAGWPNGSPAPTSRENKSPVPGGWDEVQSGDASWESNAAPSWEVQDSNNTWSNGEGFQCGEPPKWQTSKLWPESKSWLHPRSFGKDPHTMSDKMYKDIMDLHTLPPATRLDDDAWLDSPLQDVRVDDERLFRLLTRGREIAQKCLWAFMDKNQPQIRDRYFPGGWQQVKLEVNVLQDTLPFGCLSHRANRANLARDALFKVVPLRHLTCHWSHGEFGWRTPAPQYVDMHLKNVQKLAINLYDEESAMDVRRLRDEARQAVEDTFRELQAAEPFFDNYQWRYNHELMFQQIEYAREEGKPELFRFPGVVYRAENAWSRRRSSLNQGYDTSTSQTDEQKEDHTGDKTEDQAEDHAGLLRRQSFSIRTPRRRNSICSMKSRSSSVHSL